MYAKGGFTYLFTGWKINSISSTAVAVLYTPISDKVHTVISWFHRLDEPWLSDLITMALTGSIITVIMTPVDALATLTLNESSHYGRTSYPYLYRKIIRKHGYKGFFFGWKPALMALIPHTVLATFVYRFLRTPPFSRLHCSSRRTRFYRLMTQQPAAVTKSKSTPLEMLYWSAQF